MIAGLLAKKGARDSFEAVSQHNVPKVLSSWRDDGTLIFPGEIPLSGTFKGKAAIEGFFKMWFDHFPSIHFDIKDIYVKSIFGFRTNTIVVHWDVEETNRYGRVGKNSGVSVINTKGRKVIRLQDFIFDQSENWKRLWEAD
jgi:hypothetical protein